MPQFKYEVKRSPTEAPSTGVLEADSQQSAVARLRDLGYFPISVEEFEGKVKKDVLRNKLTRIRLKDRNVFFRQLANLFESGMPLTRALSTLEEQSDHVKLKTIIAQIRDDVQKGSTFAEALERHPKVFSPMVVSLINAGESGGMLDEVMWRIVAFGEQDEELRGKATTASIYPAFLLLMGSIAIFILLSFVFPKFITVFQDFQQTLPLPTRMVMLLCGFMGSYWWAVLIAIGFAVSAFVSYWRSEAGRLQIDRQILRVPVVGNVAHKYVIAQFARTLGTLLDNGVPILQSLRITVETLTNKAVAAEIAKVEARVAEGDSISAGLKLCRYFPPIVVNTFAVGEESGRLGAVTKRMADAYDIEVDRAVKAMTSMMEPILIVVMGVIVGFLVIAMLLPMLTMSSMQI
ncbi:MAG: pilus assembly protein PilC [Candidatus Hydrogenedentota bacterium]